jgi:hypothetical protein
VIPVTGLTTVDVLVVGMAGMVLLALGFLWLAQQTAFEDEAERQWVKDYCRRCQQEATWHGWTESSEGVTGEEAA